MKNLKIQAQDEPFSSAPPLEHVKLFLRWRCRKGQARLDQKMTIYSIRKEFHQWQRAVRYDTCYSYSASDVRAIITFIEDLPSLEGASTKKRTKSVAHYSDIEDILYYLWCCDDYVWRHPRQMVQISFYLLVVAYYGLRPGEIVESSSHRNSNEGVKYKDASLCLY
ncbi:hypothetical protein BCR34DRAFT_482612 [Clohesyomyces aquaticus]|uniref:Uncharacterized protein n=1 Tax=Clohesyomyces aquaticus TaxID=1231657 RepID=A0A1Y1ZQD3_9PLEO|nr:hypothetical protein BCR34DRAFT_482612 [Clohesyomyces aquaticus]